MVDVGNTAALVQYVNDKAPQYGLDPAAVLAIASQEGWSGNVGDGGTSFGPWQLHVGGAAPSSLANMSQQQANSWAWSSAGIDYVLNAMSGISQIAGHSGYAAVSAISQFFERPSTDYGPSHRNLQQEEIAGAWNQYAGFSNGTNTGTAGSVSTVDPSLSSSASIVSGESTTSTSAGTDQAPSFLGSPALGKIFARLSSSGFWWSVGFFVLAGVLILVGLYIYFRQQIEGFISSASAPGATGVAERVARGAAAEAAA